LFDHVILSVFVCILFIKTLFPFQLTVISRLHSGEHDTMLRGFTTTRCTNCRNELRNCRNRWEMVGITESLQELLHCLLWTTADSDSRADRSKSSMCMKRWWSNAGCVCKAKLGNDPNLRRFLWWVILVFSLSMQMIRVLPSLTFQ
jgi:hypothetical protein